jgi:hypothetical protein
MSALVLVALPTAALLVALLSAWGLHRVWLVARLPRPRPPTPPASLEGPLPVVTVQIPVFNEAAVVERAVDAACALKWPAGRLEVQVLDDSTDETTRLAEAACARARLRGADAQVLHRASRDGYKAGALAAALPRARGSLIAIFDADFLPPPDFLQRAVPPLLADPGLGLVQARWGHLNRSASWLTRAQGALLDGHFCVEHAARAASGAFFNFNGTAGVWRRAAIEGGGGWSARSITEDLDLSYRSQLAGWRFHYDDALVVPAELPADARGFRVQQARWAAGTLQAARWLVPAVLRARLPVAVKAEALAHLGANLAWPGAAALAILLPLAAPARAALPAGSWPWELGVMALSVGATALYLGVAAHRAGRGAARGLAELPVVLVVGAGLCLSQSVAVARGLFTGDRTFHRTPKAGTAGSAAERPGRGPLPLAEALLAVWNLAGVVVSLRAGVPGAAPAMALFAAGLGLFSAASVLPGRRPAPLRRSAAPAQPGSAPATSRP